MHTLEALNQALFLTINATTSTPRWQIDVASFIADYVIYFVPLMLAALWLSGIRNNRATALRACCVVLLALGFNQVIGHAWLHPRPFMIGLGHTFIEHAPDSSFPAGLAVAWARVFVGVHYPLDMAGAVAIACVAHGVARPLWSLAGGAVTDRLIALYRKVLAWPIARGWLVQ